MKKSRGKPIDSGEFVYGWYFEHKDKAYIIPSNIRILPLGYTHGPPSMDGFIEVHPDSVEQSTGETGNNGRDWGE